MSEQEEQEFSDKLKADRAKKTGADSKAEEKTQSDQGEQGHAEKLKAERPRRVGGTKAVKNAIKQSTELFHYIKTEDYLFVGMAGSVAVLKDISDLVAVGSLPAIGTVLTLMATVFIAASMYLAGANGQRKNKLFFQKALTYIGGTGTEFIFGIDFLPIETTMVAYLYYLLLKERMGSKED